MGRVLIGSSKHLYDQFYSNTSVFVTLAKIFKVSNGRQRVAMFVVGGNEFGISTMPLVYVTGGWYSSPSAISIRLCPTSSSDVGGQLKFGYWSDSNYMYIGMTTKNWMDLSVLPILISSPESSCGILNTSSTQPSGWTIISTPTVSYT